MLTRMNTVNTESTTTAPRGVTSEAAKPSGTGLPEMDGRAHHQLRRGEAWNFTRHLLEMVVAMLAGMAVLGVALGVLGEPPGYDAAFVKYSVMLVAMSVPMVAWMRYRHHPWIDAVEMVAAMAVPTYAVVLLSEVALRLSTGALMTYTHVAMFGGMTILMLFQWDRYARHHLAHES